MREALDIAPLGLSARAWSLLTLLLGIGLTLWVVTLQQRDLHQDHQRALAGVADSSQAALLQQLQSCELLVKSIQGLFLASEEVTPEEFAVAYANLQPRRTFPSMQAMAYARRVLRPDGVHFITERVLPRAGNERVQGLDINHQPSNLAAVLRSRDSDDAALSAPFRLVQLDPRNGPSDGITLRLPVYSQGPPPKTLQERRQRMRGSLAVSFRSGDLVGGALPADARERLHVIVEDVTDGVALPLYDSHPGLEHAGDDYRVVRELDYGGRHWRLSLRPASPMPAGLDWRSSMLLPGLFVSGLLALLVWSAATTRRHALELGSQMSRRYRESEERFRSLNELMPALVLLARADDGRIDYANLAARERLGSQIDSGAVLGDLFDDDDVRALLGNIDDDGKWRNIESMLRTLNDDRFWASTSISPVQVEGQRKLLMVAKDISEQRQLTELLSYQATHDTLTELYNRREFERHVERALLAVSHGGPMCAVLYIDLDQFKLINDTSGHLAGDQLLGQLALAMAEQLRSGDVLARLGGDEFGILALNANADGVEALAERVRTRIEGYIYVWDQHSYTISASIGVVLIDRPGLTLREVLSHADSACYMAKDHGRNRIHFYSAQDDETVRRRGEMEWAHRLRWVIEHERLLLDYQEVRPLQTTLFDAADPHIELLIRLRDEDGRVVMPGAFLPAAERYGLLTTLDRWVIAQAIAHFDRLHVSARPPGRCSLNLSASTLEDAGLADFILGLVDRHQVPPSRLCFEITETEAVRNMALAIRFIERLREAGCLIALDDFGAGMSSFGYLKNLPVDVIKIDGSFIRDIEHDTMSRSIVEAVAAIGHQRGLEVVAEWVDSERMLPTLRELGVDYAQGFALHRPEPVLFQRASRTA